MSIGFFTNMNCESPLALSCSNFLTSYVTHRIQDGEYSFAGEEALIRVMFFFFFLKRPIFVMKC
jgi:hypothetical protein